MTEQENKTTGGGMTIEDFEKLARARFENCLELMCGEKHKEYSRYDDKLYNFKKAAEIKANITPETALSGMMMKHIVSVLDMVDDIENYQELPSERFLNEKITDSINYLVLLYALIFERRMLHETMQQSDKL